MQIPKFKIRASQVGKIMTDPRTKAAKDAGELSEGAKSYCEQWLTEQIYDRRKEVTSKYLDKGNMCEQESIEMLSNWLKMPNLSKNEITYHLPFLVGTPDILAKDLVIDVKNSYDPFTFPIFEQEIPNKDYFYQLQAYMALTGKDKALLVYTLNDLPEELIQAETWSYCRKNNIDYTEGIEMEIRGKHTYLDIPTKLKIKTFELQYDKTVIERVQARVEQCQTYINQLIIQIS